MMRFAARLWSRFMLRGIQFSGKYGKLDHLYLAADPWDLRSERERIRFDETNAMITAQLGHCGSLLEIGCGEGVQSLHLKRICDHLTGVDVSARAIARAAERLPEARFLVGEGERAVALFGGQRFDLVTLCEVLYYSTDPAAVLEAAQALGDAVFVSAYDLRFEQLAHLFEGPGWMALDDIVAEGTRWRCVLWKKPAHA